MQRRIVVAGVGLLAVLLGFWATAAGQIALPPPRTESSAGSLRFRTDRQAADRLAAARVQFQQGHVAEGLRQLGQVSADAFVADGELMVAGAWAAEELRRTLTPPQRQLYDIAAEASATTAWDHFQQTQAPSDLQEFCRDMGDTPVGLIAWQTLAGRHRDLGQSALAAAAWERVRRHPSADTRIRATAVVGLVEVAIRSGDTAQAARLADEYRALLKATTVRLRGQDVTAATIVESLLASTPAASHIAEPIAERPALTTRWTWPLRPPRDLGPHLDQWLRELRDNGVWLLPASAPVLTENLVLIRSPQALIAIDRQTGESAWQIPFDDWPWIETNPGILENAGFRAALLEQMGKRLLADSVMNRLVVDDERVYVALESRQSQGSPANFGAPLRNGDGPAVSGERFNHLAAYRLDTGELAWKIGGAPAGPAYPLGGEFFCGPPTVVDNVLFVPGQQQTELQLLALDTRRGELLWRTTLGDLPRPLNADPARQRIACPIVWHDGLLLCPTAAGALVAVDPLTHAARWAYRYGVAARNVAQLPRGESTAYLPDLWWSAWRDVTLKCAGSVAVLASPESDRLHALNLETGRPRWNVPRGDGLMLLDVIGEQVLVAESTAIRAHDLSTGRVVWRTSVGEVAGRAVVTNTHVIVPTSSSQVVRLRLSDGRREPGTGQADAALGNLVVERGEWYAVSTDAVTAWSDLAAVRTADEAAWRQLPTDAGLTQRSARRALEAGDAATAWDRLMGDHSAEGRALKRFAARDILSREPHRWTEFRDSMAIGSSSAVEHVEWAIVLAEAAGDRLGAIDLLLAAISDAPTNGAIMFENPRRRVRPDLALSGAVASFMRLATETEKSAINAKLEEKWQKAAAGTDPFAVQRLTERWSGWEFTRQKLSAAGEAAFLGLPLVATELRLLEAAGSTSPKIQLAALTELMRQKARNGFPREADDYRLALLRGDHGVDAQAAAATMQPHGGAITSWPSTPPQPDSQREKNDDVYQFPVPLDGDSSPLFDRLDIHVDRQGKSIRFSGGGVSGGWTVALPASNSPFRYLQHHATGWGRGSLLILRVGVELFALAPFNDRGEPQAKVLWTLDTAGQTGISHDRLRLDVVPAAPGIREDEYRVIDPYNRIVGQVGPVRPGYLCYAEKAKLIAVDTLTGQRRWERADLPPGCLLGGDDDVVFVWQPQSHELLWLQAIDGRTLKTVSWPVSPDNVVLQAGRLFWHRAGTKLTCTDLFDERTLWTHPLRTKEVPFALAGRTLGLVRPGGGMQLLSALTGQPQGDPIPIESPSEIDRVVVARDDAHWFVAVSERVPQQAGLQQTQLRSGFRAPFMTGPLVAIDRQTPARLWQALLEREPWPADQPRSSPLLMQVYKQPAADLQSGKHPDGVVQVRDKRDGSLVFRKQHSDLIGYALMTADPDRAVIDLQLEKETVRLRYRPLPPPPAMPEK